MSEACPDCDKPLRPTQKKCKCGWTRPLRHMHCSHENCENPAMIRERMPQGWANLCYYHSDQYHLQIARDYCDKMGLSKWPEETAQEHQERIREWVRMKIQYAVREQKDKNNESNFNS